MRMIVFIEQLLKLEENKAFMCLNIHKKTPLLESFLTKNI